MTIKVRIILGLLLTIVIMASSTIPYVTSKMRDNAEQAYLEASGEQLQIMGSYIRRIYWRSRAQPCGSVGHREC